VDKYQDTYENEEELVKEREEKICRLNKRSMTNEDVDEKIKREIVLEIWRNKLEE